MKLYHYTSFDSFVHIWFTKTLLFSKPGNVNDILERTRGVKTNNILHWEKLQPFSDLLEKYKQISLTLDYSDKVKGFMSPMMWGQYGCKGQGVCIELDRDSIECPEDVWDGPITYTDYLQYIKLPDNATSEDDMSEYIRENKEDILFKKHTSWEKENEYRFISRSQEKLDISNAISAIYVHNGRNNDAFILHDIVSNHVPVRVFKYEEISGILSPKVYSWEGYQRMFENTAMSQEETDRLVASFGIGNKA